jgi:hypothetical protein
MTLLSVLIVAQLASEEPCTPIPVYDSGRPAGTVCAERPGAEVTVVDLRDDWAPRLFSETAEALQTYRATFIALANERPGPSREWDMARRDRHYELFGISPSLGVVRARLLDEARHACDARIDDQPLRAVTRTLAPGAAGASAASRAAFAAAADVVQDHLRCSRLLAATARAGEIDEPTREALAVYQRQHMIPSPAVVDAETREALLAGSAELDFRTLLRVLRERVVDATGLLEDGSALNAWEPVLGRFIDSPEYRRAMRPQPLAGGAPDLVARATEAAAHALGWTSFEAARRALSEGVPPRIAVHLPPVPDYHRTSTLQLRAEVDRGDVWTEYPLDGAGRPRPSPVHNRPTLVVYAQTATGEVPLVRWPTTIGAWQKEKLADGSVVLRYKASPVGRRYWRDLVAAPAWFPPPTTPDEELVRRRPDGRWAINDDAIGPGYRSAYGLMALLHFREVGVSGGATTLADVEIRTHGSGNYRSILRGSSHGCHRLFNHLAIRLGSFLLAHHAFTRHGPIQESYARTLSWKGRTLHLRVEGRGYRYELEPPVAVDVLPGRPVRSSRRNTRPAPAGPSPLPGTVAVQ